MTPLAQGISQVCVRSGVGKECLRAARRYKDTERDWVLAFSLTPSCACCTRLSPDVSVWPSGRWKTTERRPDRAVQGLEDTQVTSPCPGCPVSSQLDGLLPGRCWSRILHNNVAYPREGAGPGQGPTQKGGARRRYISWFALVLKNHANKVSLISNTTTKGIALTVKPLKRLKSCR